VPLYEALASRDRGPLNLSRSQISMHGKNHVPFRALTYAGQASSINGTVSYSKRALERNLDLAAKQNRDPEQVFWIRANQYLRMLASVAKKRGFKWSSAPISSFKENSK